MSLSEVLAAFYNVTSPPEHVVMLMQRLDTPTKNYPSSHAKPKKTSILEMLNMISLNNKENWLPKIKTYIHELSESESEKTDDCLQTFIRAILSQPLFTEIYVEIFDFFSEFHKQKIIDIIFSNSMFLLDSKKSILLGKFMGLWILMSDMNEKEIFMLCDAYIDKYPGFVVAVSIELCTSPIFKKIALKYYKQLENKKHETSILMLIYNLEDLL